MMPSKRVRRRGFDADALARVFAELQVDVARAKFVVAYSGGGDSHVLLHALSHCVQCTVTAAHFDHALADESAEWAKQCAEVCRQWNVEFITARADETETQHSNKNQNESPEARARRQRYDWFANITNPEQILLTAHHADDHAETVLLNLLRGGDARALAGIPQHRRLPNGAQLLRPLLSFSRAALREYAQQHNLSWIEDPSNRAEDFDRNYLRHSVMPLLTQRWSGAVNALAHAADNCRAVADYVDAEIAPLLTECADESQRGVFCLAPPLNVRTLKRLNPFQVTTLIRHWINRYIGRPPSSRQLATFHQQVFSARATRASVKWHHTELRLFRDHLYLIANLPTAPTRELQWDGNDCTLGNGIRLTTSGGGNLDRQSLRGKSLCLVWRNGGERMTLPRRRHSSELKKLFQANAVPPWERHALPLLVADGEIAWAHGIGAAAAVACEQGDDARAIRLRFVAEQNVRA